MSLREDIIKIVDIPEKTVKVKEWGGKIITIRGLTAGERLLAGQQVVDKDDPLEYALRLVVLAVRNPKTGEREFTEGDIPLLRDRSAKVIDMIRDVVLDLSSGGAADLEQAEKNS